MALLSPTISERKIGKFNLQKLAAGHYFNIVRFSEIVKSNALLNTMIFYKNPIAKRLHHKYDSLLI